MYKFDPAAESIAPTFRAIALSQLDDALLDLDKTDSDLAQIVHEGRRRCKKLRGLLRLVRPAFLDFARENGALRDAAALLSHLRDADVLRHTISQLAEHTGDGADRLRAIAQHMLDRSGTAAGDEQLRQFREAIIAIRDRAREWALTRESEAMLIAGLRRTYRNGRRLMHKSARSRIAAQLHEWRKATKYHGFHLDLLKRTAPDLLDDDLKTVEQLATCLGCHHDLAVLGDLLALAPERFGDVADATALRLAIAQRTPEIERKAFELGRQVFAERPKAVAHRFRAYWQATDE